MFDLLIRKFHKVVKVLKEDETRPVNATLVMGKKGRVYQHAVVQFELPEGYSLKYNWMRPGIDAPDCTHDFQYDKGKCNKIYIVVGIRKPLEKEME